MPEPDAIDSSPPAPGAGAAAATTNNALPAGFTCPKCDYDLGGSGAKVCSECGRAVEQMDLAAFYARAEAVSMLPTLIRKRLGYAVVAVLVMSTGAAVFSLGVVAAFVTSAGRKQLSLIAVDTLMSAMMAAALCCIALVGSFYVGWAAASIAPARDRAAIRVAWMTAMPWLHGPWLILPLFCGVGVIVVLLFADLTNQYTAHSTIRSVFGMPGASAWLIPALVSLIVGMQKLKKVLREFGVKRRVRYTTLAVAWVTVPVGAISLGAAGLMFAEHAVFVLIGQL